VRMEYKREDQAFHPLDVPAHAHTRRVEVKSLRRPRLIGPTVKHDWDSSVTFPRKPCERLSAQLLDHDRKNWRMNYRAEVLPTAASVERDAFGRITGSSLRHTNRTLEMTVHPALDQKPAWDGGTQASDSRARARRLEVLTAAARRSTARKAGKIEGYVPPVERERQRMKLLRAQRIASSTRVLEVESEFRGVGADSKAIAQAAARGMTLTPALSESTKGRTAFGIKMVTRE
jgi:hypothetical protein